MGYEEERKTAMCDGFLEMPRKELLNASLEEDVREVIKWILDGAVRFPPGHHFCFLYNAQPLVV